MKILFNPILLHRRPFLMMAITVLLFTGCREQVKDEFPDFTPVPTVNCFLVADSLLKVHVSMAERMDTVPLTLVDQATVSCFVNDSLAGELAPSGNGYYTGQTVVKAGNVYRVRVAIPGYPEVNATDTIPEQVRLTSIEHINEAGVDEEGYPFPGIRISFPVNPGRIQYFEVSIRVNNYKNTWSSAYFRDFSDTVLLAEGLPIAVFNTGRIHSDSYTLRLDYSPSSYYGSMGVLQPNLDPLIVEFKTISWSYYQYLRQLYLYETGRYPDFSFGPLHTFPLYSNVTNGMGIVAGYSMYRSAIITPVK